jgi:acylphosphatase
MTEEEEKGALNAVVRGVVQAVGFRQFVIMHARSLGLCGYVRNGNDGRSVEIVAEGPRPALEELVRRLWKGPFMARVDSVQVRWLPPSGEFSHFEARF